MFLIDFLNKLHEHGSSQGTAAKGTEVAPDMLQRIPFNE